MKFLLILFLLLSAGFCVIAQTTISGTVADEKGEPVPFATVYLDELFEGGSSEMNGTFSFKIQSKGTFTLIGSAVGYETHKQSITVGSQSVTVNLTLRSASRVLGPVIISAGSFDASDKAKSTLLRPLDIVMNAGAEGDIYQAIETLPGVSQVGEETGLFVRGGDAHETKTLIDGTAAEKPFFSETPNIASRSRFDPFMFKGTQFTTGGYSAEYGRALSSVLILETQDIPESTASSAGINMAGINVSHQRVWKGRTALLGDVSYHNLGLLFRSVPQNVDWAKEPEGFGTNWAFRHKTKSGMFKTHLQHQRGKIGVHTNNFEHPDDPHLFANENQTTYWNASYKGTISDKLGTYAGVAWNDNLDDVSFDTTNMEERSQLLHGKMVMYYDPFSSFSMKIGGEIFADKEGVTTPYYKGTIEDQYSALFAESDIALGTRWALRLGLRAEYSVLLRRFNAAPRTSMAYKTGKDSQISLAYGHFYQKPEEEYLFYDQNLGYERATHFIANYQWITEYRSFRLEVYDKQYVGLVKGEPEMLLRNDGKGFGRGIDLFWKDEKTIRDLSYWVSYSYIDARRDYRDYPSAATPTFVTDHTFNLVANYSLKHLGLRPGLTYTFASGRRYFNPTSERFLSDKTKAYHNLNVNVSYITELFGNFSVLYGALSNPLGIEQIFGYEYSADGTERLAIRPTTNRSFFLGLFINF